MSPIDDVDGGSSRSQLRDEEKGLENSALNDHQIDDEKAYVVTWDEHDPDKSVSPCKEVQRLNTYGRQSSQLVDAVPIMAHVPTQHASFGGLVGFVHHRSG